MLPSPGLTGWGRGGERLNLFFCYLSMQVMDFHLAGTFTFFVRHYQKGLRLDPEHGELKKAYFGLKNLLKKTKSVSKVFYIIPSLCVVISV